MQSRNWFPGRPLRPVTFALGDRFALDTGRPLTPSRLDTFWSNWSPLNGMGLTAIFICYWEGCCYQNRWSFRKVPKGGEGVIFNRENDIAKFPFVLRIYLNKSATWISENEGGVGRGQRVFGTLQESAITLQQLSPLIAARSQWGSKCNIEPNDRWLSPGSSSDTEKADRVVSATVNKFEENSFVANIISYRKSL